MTLPINRVRASTIIIAIMGPPGAGKSNFTNVFFKQLDVRASHGLTSRTDSVQLRHLDCFGRKLVLVELPFLNNATQGPEKIKQIIGRWSKKLAHKKDKLAGVLYMHRINESEPALTSGDAKIIRELCSDMTQVKLVTTMWDETERKVAINQESELNAKFSLYLSPLDDTNHWAKEKGFGEVTPLSPQPTRFYNTFDSARGIVESLVLETIWRENLLLTLRLEELKLKSFPDSTHARRVFYRGIQQLLGDRRETAIAITKQTNGDDCFRLAELRQKQEKTERHLQDSLNETQHYAPSLLEKIKAFFNRSKISKLSSSDEKRLYNMLIQIVKDSESRNAFRKYVAVADRDAQVIADYLNLVLHEADVFDEGDGTKILRLLFKLAKLTKVYPQCYLLKGIQKEQYAVDGGGFADVFKGYYKDYMVCLKVIRVFDNDRRTDILRTFVKEMVLWSHLSHENILPFYGVYLLDEAVPKICLVSPWMAKGNLKEYLKTVHGMAPRVLLAQDIIDGLMYLHGLNIVHGDLKALNIMVSDDGRALIADFGLSFIAATSVDSSTLKTGGTVNWQAPELLSSEGLAKATQFSDVWSFGCLLLEIFTGKYPFHKYKDSGQILNAIILGKKPGLQEPQLGDRMWNIMLGCWKWDPTKRSSCKEIQDALGLEIIEDTRPKGSLRAGGSVAFWEAMRAQSDIKIDYQDVKSIFNTFLAQRIEDSAHAGLPLAVPNDRLRIL